MKRFLKQLRLLRHENWFITVTMLIIAGSGILWIYSACYARNEPLPSYQKQIAWTVIGLLCYLSAAVADYRSIRVHVGWLYAFCLLLLVMVLLVGDERYGARRWLKIFGISIQPSEMTKLVLICTLAWYLGRPGVSLAHPRAVGSVLALAAVPAFLVIREPDLGTALVLAPVTVGMMFVGGIRLKHLLVVVGAGMVGVLLLLAALFLPARLDLSEETQARILSHTGLSAYQRERILVFFQPGRDPTGTGWNRVQSEIAVGSGGVTGKGFLNGTQKALGFLPRTVSPTDFIFAVIAEEAGFVGSALLILLFGVILFCGMKTAFQTGDKLGRLLCVGVVVMLFSHVFVNIAMTVGLMPITGLPLPLVSYGGSFMVSTMTGLGLVQSVHIRRHYR